MIFIFILVVLLAWLGISKITFFYFEDMSNISYIILPLSLL